MTDIRCPMCGKTNPAEADTCQYCQEPLTPLLAGPLENDSPVKKEPLFTPLPANKEENDWLGNLHLESDANGVTSIQENPVPEEEAPVDTDSGEPEWLTRIRKKQSLENPETPPEVARDDTPDWIKRIKQKVRGDNPSQISAEEIPVQNASASHLNDDDQQDPAQVPPAAGEFAAGVDKTIFNPNSPSEENDSLTELQKQIPVPQTIIMPDRALDGNSFIENDSAALDNGIKESDQEILRISSQDYSWLDSIKEAALASADGTDEAKTLFSSPDDDSQAPLNDNPDLSSPLGSDGLPKWLSDPQLSGEDDSSVPVEDVQPQSSPMESGDSNLNNPLSSNPDTPEQAGGENQNPPELIPGWSETLRSVENLAASVAALSAAFVENENRVENNGPLAGFQGTLPTDLPPIPVRPPPLYSNALYISDRQNGHARLLENLVSFNRPPYSPPKKKNKPTQAPRLILGLMLVILVAVFLYFGTGETLPGGMAANMPSPAFNLFVNTIESIQPNTRVVLAVDYQPGFDGELRPAALALIQRLIEKKAGIILVSTNPSGAAIGEDLLLNQPHKEFTSQNLGYLPGGLTSLQEFAVNPRLAAPAGYRETANILYYSGLMDKIMITPVWKSDLLSGFNSVRNAAAIIVITDSLDGGRAWVEQVKPLAPSTHMLFIASAQAAPLLTPYVASGQVDGLLTGLNDGLAYRAFLKQPGNRQSRGIADALNIGVFYIILVVIAGVLVQLIRFLISLPKHKNNGVRR